MKKNSYNLFLDDIRNPDWVTRYKTDPEYNKLKWITVRSYDEFVDYVNENGMPRLISFDHDLADEHYFITVEAIRNGFDIKTDFKEMTGYDALKWICDYSLDNNIPLPEMKFHTANYIGLKNMESYYNNFMKHHSELK